jgi:hypothetical protein
MALAAGITIGACGGSSGGSGGPQHAGGGQQSSGNLTWRCYISQGGGNVAAGYLDAYAVNAGNTPQSVSTITVKESTGLTVTFDATPAGYAVPAHGHYGYGYSAAPGAGSCEVVGWTP